MSNLSIIERPIALDQLPNFLIKDHQLSEAALKATPIQAATEFAKAITELLDQQNKEDLLTLYDFKFKRLSGSEFK